MQPNQATGRPLVIHGPHSHGKRNNKRTSGEGPQVLELTPAQFAKLLAGEEDHSDVEIGSKRARGADTKAASGASGKRASRVKPPKIKIKDVLHFPANLGHYIELLKLHSGSRSLATEPGILKNLIITGPKSSGRGTVAAAIAGEAKVDFIDLTGSHAEEHASRLQENVHAKRPSVVLLRDIHKLPEGGVEMVAALAAEPMVYLVATTSDHGVANESMVSDNFLYRAEMPGHSVDSLKQVMLLVAKRLKLSLSEADVEGLELPKKLPASGIKHNRIKIN